MCIIPAARQIAKDGRMPSTIPVYHSTPGIVRKASGKEIVARNTAAKGHTRVRLDADARVSDGERKRSGAEVSEEGNFMPA
jgi:hypothetical protein